VSTAMSPISKSKSKFKRRSTKKVPKKKDAEYEKISGTDFDAFVKEARNLKSDFVICGSDEDDMVSVTEWIEMPPQIQEVIGTPGIPCGLISMVYGEPDTGKTSFCNEALASTQRAGGFGVLFLSELKYDERRAAAQGIQCDGKKGSLIKYRPRTIEEVGDLIFQVSVIIDKSKTKKPVCIVWDSLGATPCENELNEARSNFSMDAAKAITGVLRKTQGLIRDKKIAFVMINQLYDKTGVTFGKKTTTRGGKSPRYYSALQLSFSKLGRIRPPGKKAPHPFCGIRTKIEAEKNHLGQPFKSVEMEIDWKGFVIDRKPEYVPEGFYDGVEVSE